jgi:hypothetical protein
LKAIYTKDEKTWLGVDIDDGSKVDQRLYDLMLDFLKQYFYDDPSSKDQTTAKDQASQLE